MKVTLSVPAYRKVEFPGRAGALQSADDVVGLVAELGDNYSGYHDFLASQVERFGGVPDPGEYGEDLNTYLNDVANVQELLNAEVFLRRCYAKRQLGISFNHDADRITPLVDEWHRLIPFHTGVSKRAKNPRNDPASATPAPLPRFGE